MTAHTKVLVDMGIERVDPDRAIELARLLADFAGSLHMTKDGESGPLRKLLMDNGFGTDGLEIHSQAGDYER